MWRIQRYDAQTWECSSESWAASKLCSLVLSSLPVEPGPDVGRWSLAGPVREVPSSSSSDLSQSQLIWFISYKYYVLIRDMNSYLESRSYYISNTYTNVVNLTHKLTDSR